MERAIQSAYDGATGTAGGAEFGAALATLAAERGLDTGALAAAAGLGPALIEQIVSGERRVSVAVLAALSRALRVRPIEFMQRTGLLSLAVYAGGLDPLFFLPDGPIRHDARIYMREINPRHAVPEGDMTKRNPLLKLLSDDPLLDPVGKLELELTYLLRTAVLRTGGTL
jgi:transcriptional regulator with XRE-family HTH domain